MCTSKQKYLDCVSLSAVSESKAKKTPQFLVIDFVTFHCTALSDPAPAHVKRNLNVIKSRITLSIKPMPKTPNFALGGFNRWYQSLHFMHCVDFIVNLYCVLCNHFPSFFSDTEKLPWEKRRNILSVTSLILLTFRSCNWSCLCSFHLIGTPLWYYSPMKKLQAFGSNASS